jgi:hypothetical protein
MRHEEEIIVIALPPERQPARTSGRESYQSLRPRKLRPDQEEELIRNASGRSLRELSACFGVSHESVRCILASRLQHAGMEDVRARRKG